MYACAHPSHGRERYWLQQRLPEIFQLHAPFPMSINKFTGIDIVGRGKVLSP